MRVAGVHLAPSTDGSSESISVVVEIEGGAVNPPRILVHDDDIVAALPPAPAFVVVDAPLAVPNASGKRDVESVLAWCDIPAFPVSRRRMETVYGGARGIGLAQELVARGYDIAETIPDAVFRELMWERERPAGLPPLDLLIYRERWLGIRPPDFRHGKRGKSRGEALAAARALLADVLDLDRWDAPSSGDEGAAELGAIACAYAAWRHATGSGSVDIGTAERGRMVLPAGADLARRIALTVKRLRSEGSIGIP